MGLNIKRGVNRRAVRCVIYGTEGIGKTTLSAQAPSPVFIDLEHGSDQMDVARIDDVLTWEGLLNTLRQIETAGICRTVIIDTADAADRLCMEYTIRQGGSGVNGIEDFGFGKGYTYNAENYSKFLAECDRVVAAGINVILIAHAIQRSVNLPEQLGSYDHWEMKLSKKTGPLVKEWADMLLFMNYKTVIVTTNENKKKGTGGTERIVYSVHDACWDAKNRHGLPDHFPAKWEYLAPHFYDEAVEPAKEPIQELLEKLKTDNLDVIQFEAVVSQRRKEMEGVKLDEYSPDFIRRYCLKYYTQIIGLINKEDV